MADNPFAAELEARADDTPSAEPAGLNPFSAELTKRVTTSSPFKQFISGVNETFFAPTRWTTGAKGRQVLKERFYPEDPQTPADRVFRRMGEAVPETLAMGSGLSLVGQAARGVPTVAQTLAGNIRAAVTAPYGAVPTTRAVATDVAGGTGAAAGAQGYREANPDAGAGGEMVAGLAGGTAATALPSAVQTVMRYSPTRAAIKTIFDLVPDDVIARLPFGREYLDSRRAAQTARVMPMASEALKGLKEPEMAGRLDEANRLRREIPGFNPSLGESTGLPSAVASQRSIEAAASGADLDKLATRRRSSEQAVEGYRNANAPEPQSPALVTDAVTRRLDEARSLLATQQARAGERAAEAAERVPEVDRYELGDRLRNRMLGIKSEVSEAMSLAARNLGLDDTLPVPFPVLRDRLKAIVPSQFADRDTLGNAMMRAIEWKPSNEAGPVTFGDVRFLREQLGDEAREALRAGRRNQARILGDAQKEIDAFIENDWLGQFQVTRPAGRRGVSPYEPEASGPSLAEYVRKAGGVRDEGGEISAIIGSRGKTAPGIINDRSGNPIDDLALKAWELGYFPGATERPTRADFLEALRADFSGTRRYAGAGDAGRARQSNMNLERSASELGVDPRGLSPQQLDQAMRAQLRADESGDARAVLAENYKKFREIYRREYIDRFEKNAARSSKAKGIDSDFRVDAEDVPRQWFNAGDVSSIRQFHRTFGGDLEANAALRDYVLDDIRRAAVRDGEIDPARFDRWMRRHKSVLLEVPEVAQEVASVARAQAAVQSRQAALNRRAEVIEDSILARRATQGVDALVKEALTDPRRALQVMRGMQPPERRAMARAVWDRALRDGDPEALGAFLRNNRDTLTTILGSKHVEALSNIQRATGMLGNVPAPAGRATDANPLKGLEDRIGSGLPQLSSRAFAVMSGRTGVKYALTDLLARAGIATSRARAGEIVKQALYDQDFAVDLANFARAPNGPNSPTAKRLRAYVSALGIDVLTPGRSVPALSAVEDEDRSRPRAVPARMPERDMIQDALDVMGR